MHPAWDAERRESVRTELLGLGFDAVRFTEVSGVPAERLRAWLAAGYHADMEWIARGEAKRSDPALVLPGATSLVVLGINYLPATTLGSGLPVWARYARWADYHDTVLAGLERAARVLETHGVPQGGHRYYVDTGPVLERGWAARAGLGFQGRNAMLISREHGNWLFLAAILVAARIPPDAPLGGERGLAADGGATTGLYCGSCSRCLDACPTQAFPQPGIVDARRCVSYHTIENKGVIPRELRAHFGQRVYGCDTCLEVCPWNRFAQAGRAVLLEAREAHAELPLEALLSLTPERFAALFKGTAVKRLKLRGLLRNACVAAGNSGRVELLPLLVALASHAEPLVRAHAVWAVRRLDPEGAGERLASARASESDPVVLEEFLESEK